MATNTTASDELQLTNADYIPNSEVENYPDTTTDIAAIPRNYDSFGNILNALLFDSETVYETLEIALASRRDDCYNQDGSRPDWSIITSGTITGVATTNDEWEGIDLGTALESVIDSLDIEGYTTDDADNIVVEVYDQGEAEYFTLTFIVEA
ncbi:hypothetical protein [Halomontanus rarus]|uniref:hypothetical protein n=1 Tax=Halomontanus rarus TaxID=3034020 RepID=UPI001A99A04D